MEILDKRRQQDLIQWRREQVFIMWSRGHTKTSISKTLQVSRDTVNEDLKWLLEHHKDQLKFHLTKGLPEHYLRCMNNLEQVLLESWTIHEEQQTQKNPAIKLADRVAVLNLIMNCSKAISELSNNEGIVSQSIEFAKNANSALNKYRERTNSTSNTSNTNYDTKETQLQPQEVK